jgi:hypothetical protein
MKRAIRRIASLAEDFAKTIKVADMAKTNF